MTLAPPSSRDVITCSGVDCRLPALSAFARNNWITLATSSACAENAVPNVSVQSRWSASIAMTSGKRASACTEESHGRLSTCEKSPFCTAF